MFASPDQKPELERHYVQDPHLDHGREGSFGFIRYLQHGVPTPLVRWHHHDEYELHLIVATHGRAFVGDYVGHFEPGHLVLTGPRLPHNWISSHIPPEGVPLRDMLLQFPDAPLRQAAELIPDLRAALPLLDRSRLGIEFFGISQRVQQGMERIRQSQGLPRFSEFLAVMGELARCSDYRLLSSSPLESTDSEGTSDNMSRTIDYIIAHSNEPLSLAELSQRAGMCESQFSRQFRRITGNSLPDFINRLRIARACQLLMETDQYVGTICYESGFNNVANFNRRFLEVKGITPREFRRQAQARLTRSGAISPRDRSDPERPSGKSGPQGSSFPDDPGASTSARY